MRGKKKLKHTITRPVSSESEISSESENVYTSTPARQDPPPLSSKLSQIKTKNSSGSAAVKGQPSTKSLVEENSPAKGRPRKNPPKKRKVSPLKDIQPSHSGPSTSRQADEAEKRHYSRSRRDSLSPPSRHSPPVSGPRSRSHSPVSVPSRSGRTPTQASTRGHQSFASNPPGRQGMHHPVATAVAGRHRSIGPPRRRRAPGEKALQEIRHYQKSVGLLMAKMPFARLVREILQEMHSSSFYWQASAIEALQESSEIYLVRLFEDSVCCTIHANRKTLMVRDMQLTRRLRISCGLF